MFLARSLIIAALLAGVAGAASAQEARLLGLTQTQSERLGVTTVPLRAAERAARAELPARIIASRDGARPVVAPFSGVVDQVFAMPGAAIGAGDPVVSILSRDYQENLSGLEQARAEAQLANAETERQRELHREGLISKSDLDTSEARFQTARAMLAEHERFARNALPGGGGGGAYTLRAPASGRVANVSVSAGDALDAMSPVASIVLDGSLWAEIQIPGRLLGEISAGDRVQFGPELNGQVLSAGAALDPKTRSATAIATVPENSGARIGDILRVRIDGERADDAVLEAPASSVIPVEDEVVVFVVTSAGFNAVPVEVLGRTSETVTISGDLSAGDEVATRGLTELKAVLLAGGE